MFIRRDVEGDESILTRERCSDAGQHRLTDQCSLRLMVLVCRFLFVVGVLAYGEEGSCIERILHRG
jgi:hypothetical protein